MKPYVLAIGIGSVGAAIGVGGEPLPRDVRVGPLAHTDFIFEPTHFASLDAWQVRRERLRDQVRFATGVYPELERTSLAAMVFGKVKRDGYTIEKVHFQSMPGLYVTGNLYRPVGIAGKRPAVACPHGHWELGRLHHDENGSVPARCAMLARLGAVVLAYDMVGYNDSGKQFVHRDEAWRDPANELWCFGPMAVQTWNSIRVIDFLQSLPDVDSNRIGVTGASGGGTQTFILSAIDDRVSVSVPVNMISGRMQGGCICENAALLRIGTNNMEIGALFAPKPMLMVSATGDWTKHTPQVEYPMLRDVYALYGAADRLANVHIDAPHNYNRDSRQAMYRFVARHLLGRTDADQIQEGSLPAERPADLLVFGQNDTPADIANREQITQQFKQAVDRQIERLEPTSRDRLNALSAVVRCGLEQGIASSWPVGGDIKAFVPATPGLPVFRRDGRNASVLRVSSGSTRSRTLTVCVHPDGLAAAGSLDGFIRKRTAVGADVILVEPFRIPRGRRVDIANVPQRFDKYFTTFNRTDAAETLFDLVTVLAAVLNDDGVKRVDLVGFESAGPLCLLALALVPDNLATSVELRAAIDTDRFNAAKDEFYVARLFIPGIRRVGGLRAISAVAVKGRTLLHNTGSSFDVDWAQKAARLAHVELQVESDPFDAEAVANWLNE